MINYTILKDKLFNNVKGLEYEGKTIKKIDDCKKGYFPHKNGCKYMFFMEEDPNHRLIPILCEADRIVEPGYYNSLIERHNKVRKNYGKDYSLTFVIYSEEEDKFIVNRNRFDILFTLEDFKNYYGIVLISNNVNKQKGQTFNGLLFICWIKYYLIWLVLVKTND